MIKKLLISIVFLACISETGHAQTGRRLRVIVIDASLSMESRIQGVREDLSKHIEDDPPSRNAPIGIILFGRQSKPVVWLHAKAKALEFVSQIAANETGTSIAAGLREAKQRLESLKAKVDVRLFLYTDDQDGTPEATEEVVEELSRLFTNRKQQNLQQQVVVRSWSQDGAGAVIKSVLAKNPAVDVMLTDQPVFIETKLVPPPKPQLYQLSVTAKPTGNVRWEDDSKCNAIYEIEWSAKATGKAPASGKPCQFPVCIKQISSGSFAGVDHELMCEAPGTTSGKFEMRVPLSPNDLVQPQVPQHPEITFAVGQQPVGVAIKPERLAVGLPQLPLPPKQETVIEMVVTGISEGTWYEVPNVAFYRIDVDATVVGPAPEGSTWMVESPPGVTRLRVYPNTLESGRRRVQLLVAAAVEPAPEQTSYEFRVSPPTDTRLIHFVAPKPLQVSLPGPGLVQLSAPGSGHAGSFTTNLFEQSASASVLAHLQLDGPVTDRFARLLKLDLSGPAISQSLGTVPANEPFIIPMRVPARTDRSYFVDSVETVSFLVRPAISTSVVEDREFQAEVRTFAPFKRHLLIGLTVLAFVGTPLLVMRLVQSLRVEKDGYRESGDEHLFE